MSDLKQLDQNLFDNKRDHVLSASIDKWGCVWTHDVKKEDLIQGDDRLYDGSTTPKMTCCLVDNHFDTTNWPNSAINRHD